MYKVLETQKLDIKWLKSFERLWPDSLKPFPSHEAALHPTPSCAVSAWRGNTVRAKPAPADIRCRHRAGGNSFSETTPGTQALLQSQRASAAPRENLPAVPKHSKESLNPENPTEGRDCWRTTTSGKSSTQPPAQSRQITTTTFFSLVRFWWFHLLFSPHFTKNYDGKWRKETAFTERKKVFIRKCRTISCVSPQDRSSLSRIFYLYSRKSAHTC